MTNFPFYSIYSVKCLITSCVYIIVYTVFFHSNICNGKLKVRKSASECFTFSCLERDRDIFFV